MNRTGIEYLDFSWNPLAMRCTQVDSGCAHCWHLRMADRMKNNPAFPPEVQAAYAGTGLPVLVQKRLGEPLKRKKPTVIGVQFMGDLFHGDIPEMFITEVWMRMMAAEWHTFLVLTKRSARMAEFVCNFDAALTDDLGETWYSAKLPAPNIWLGVSVENQAAADERREYLRQCPAAVKFVSYEPALSAIDWTGWEFVDQIISGGESGPGARPSHPDWHRATRDFCQEHNIAYFFKQWGAWTHIPSDARYPLPAKIHWWPDRNLMGRVGKKAAGCLLDGREWNEMPTHNVTRSTIGIVRRL